MRRGMSAVLSAAVTAALVGLTLVTGVSEARAQTVPSSWVSSWSTRMVPTAQVARAVSISRTSLTRGARVRGATVSYRWYVGSTRTRATGLEFKVPRSAYGRTIRVRVTVARNGMTARSLTLGFGTAKGTPQDAEVVTAARADVLADINAYRARQGLPAMREWSEMSAVAQRWTVRMASTYMLSHNESFARQIPAGWRAAAENVAMGAQPGVVSGWWMDSSAHRANILGPYNRIGIGVAVDDRGYYWYTADFGRY